MPRAYLNTVKNHRFPRLRHPTQFLDPITYRSTSPINGYDNVVLLDVLHLGGMTRNPEPFELKLLLRCINITPPRG
jgi:hypothetical protein